PSRRPRPTISTSASTWPGWRAACTKCCTDADRPVALRDGACRHDALSDRHSASLLHDPRTMAREKYYLTTPIFYPNGKPHIGHAYTVIASDAMARFQRLDGKDVFFLSGTDEHGLKMQQTAEKEGVTPKELADRNSAIFRNMEAALGASNDDFIRTTEERHYKA